MRSIGVIIVASSLAIVACSSSHDPGDGSGDGRVNEVVGSGRSAEHWSPADDPALFTDDLQRNLASLPTHGAAAVTPWSGSYWPTYADSINYKWDGPRSESPARKYEQAFGGEDIEDKVSAYFGIDSIRGRRCEFGSECDASLGEVCAKRPGHVTGTCIASWYGICHAWAPAAILLPEPKHAVVLNGVQFHVSDIKALATIVYTSTRSKFVSLRCERGTGEEPIGYDEYGRPSDPEDGRNEGACRDTNPGTYHLLLANYLGLKSQSFVQDVTLNYQVWNHPIRSFNVDRMQEISAAQANDLIGVTGGTAQAPLRTAEVRKNEWASLGVFPVTPGTSYEVQAKLSSPFARTEVYVAFDGEPDESHYDCMATVSGRTRTCSGQVPLGARRMYVAAHGGRLVSGTVSGVAYLATPAPSRYVFNREATRFVKAHSTVEYVVESSPAADGNLSLAIDQFTRTKEYDYVLEMNDAGDVVGGEWLGKSKDDHPDFVWLPIGPGSQSVAGGAIKYADVKQLLDRSVDAPETPADAGAPAVTDAGAPAVTDAGTPVVPAIPTPIPPGTPDAGTTTAPVEGTSLDASAPPMVGMPPVDAGH